MGFRKMCAELLNYVNTDQGMTIRQQPSLVLTDYGINYLVEVWTAMELVIFLSQNIQDIKALGLSAFSILG